MKVGNITSTISIKYLSAGTWQTASSGIQVTNYPDTAALVLRRVKLPGAWLYTEEFDHLLFLQLCYRAGVSKLALQTAAEFADWSEYGGNYGRKQISGRVFVCAALQLTYQGV